MGERNWTPKQRAAIDTRDRSLLVSAAAGSGKTAVLTERIIQSVLDPVSPIDINDMLIVTFTNAATGELKERIAKAVKKALEADPSSERLEKQLHLLPSAHISTIDAFCSDILKENCDRVGVNPGYRIADEAEAQLLAEGILDGMFGEIFDGNLTEVATAEELSELSDCLTDTREQGDLSMILRSLYDSTKDTERGVGTIRALVELYNPEKFVSVEKTRLGKHAIKVLREMLTHFRLVLNELLVEHIEAHDASCQKRIDVLTGDIAFIDLLLATDGYSDIRRLLRETPHVKSPSNKVKVPVSSPTAARSEYKDAKKKLLSELFEYSEDEWRASFEGLYRVLSVLVRILEHFDGVYMREKLRLGICEYSDVARFTYQCLWQNGERTEVAVAEAAKYRAVYVDEYQDVNAIQHKIFEAISTPTNRFMVGDIKQSIYGFRSAEPDIFREMKARFPELKPGVWSPENSIFMSDNFRCDKGVIDFVNAIFDRLFMTIRESISYVDEDKLNFSKVYDGIPTPEYRIPEICMLPYKKPKRELDGGDDSDEDDDEGMAEISARLVAEKIDELLRTGTLNDGSPIRPEHIAIIMRNAKGRDKKYAAALEELDIPSAIADTTSFFLNSDILLLMSILHTIDNPHRDIYLAAALASPVFNFTADELVAVSALGEPSLYDNLVRYTSEHPGFLRGERVLAFLRRYRMLAEGMAVDGLIARIFRECGLLSLAAKTGGREHLLRFLEHARQFENSTFKGLYNFIDYVNGIIDRNNSFDRREAPIASDAVKIITAHSSKGLEFPVVFYVGADQSMKRSRENMERLVFERDFGIGMYLRTPSGLSLVSNPTKSIILNYRLRKKIEEEARVLYVILTRARERLYVVGKSRSGYDKYWDRINAAREIYTPYTVYNMKNYADMVLLSTGRHFLIPEQFLPSMSDTLKNKLLLATAEPEVIPGEEAIFDLPDDPTPMDTTSFDVATRVENNEARGLGERLLERFNYRYPYIHLTRLPEKISVSKLYPDMLDPSTVDEADLEEEISKQKFIKMGRLPKFATGSDETESAKRGIATHLLFQFASLEGLRNNGAKAELERLVKEEFISQRDADRVRLDEVEMFIKSPLFAEMLAAKKIYRELRFNTRLPAKLFATDLDTLEGIENEELLVQGVIDCLILDDNGEYYLVDYKTDRLTYEERRNEHLAEKKLREAHSRQLSYYALAVEKMFGKRPARIEVYSLHLGKTVSME